MDLQPAGDITGFSPNLLPEELYGLFELDAAGTILYSRIRQNNQLINIRPEWIGQNYFKEIAPFENTHEFQLRFINFAKGRQTVESFIFNCRCRGTDVPVKVMMASAYEAGCGKPANIIILDIRKS